MSGHQNSQVSHVLQNFLNSWNHTGQQLAHDLQQMLAQIGVTGPVANGMSLRQTSNQLSVASTPPVTGRVGLPAPGSTLNHPASHPSPTAMSAGPSTTGLSAAVAGIPGIDSNVSTYQSAMRGEQRYWYNDSAKPPGTNGTCTRPLCQRKKAERLGCSMLKYGTYGPQCRNIVHSHIGCSGYQAKDFINTGNKWGCHMNNYEHDFPDDDGNLESGRASSKVADEEEDDEGNESAKVSRMRTRGQAKSKTGGGYGKVAASKTVAPNKPTKKPMSRGPQKGFCENAACTSPDEPFQDPKDPNSVPKFLAVRCSVEDHRFRQCRHQAHANLQCASVGELYLNTGHKKHKTWHCTRIGLDHDFRSDEEIRAGRPVDYDSEEAEKSSDGDDVRSGQVDTIDEEGDETEEEPEPRTRSATMSRSMPPPMTTSIKKAGKIPPLAPSASAGFESTKLVAQPATKKRQASEPPVCEPAAKKPELDKATAVGGKAQKTDGQVSTSSSLTSVEEIEAVSEMDKEGGDDEQKMEQN